jgi:acyl-ACP thioesterase
VQEAAGAHARAAGVAAAGSGAPQVWVLAELRLRVDRYPREGERVTVETWPAARLGGVRGYRDFSLVDAAGRPFGAGASLWLLLDTGSRRPERLPDAVLALRTIDRPAVDLPEPPPPAAVAA